MTRARIALTLLLCGAALLASGCSGDADSEATAPSTSTRTATASTPAAPAFRVGVATRIGDAEDPFSGRLAEAGVRRAEELLGIDGRVVRVQRQQQLEAELTELAAEGSELVIGVGTGAADAVDQVARRFPDVEFAAVDTSQRSDDAKAPNVRGLLFKEEEGGYLAGYLAGLLNATESGFQQTIGSVGGRRVPWVERYIAGFRAGARKANPRIETLEDYAQTFDDQAKCKELALDQIARGADVIFAVAGRCGLGAQAAAKELNVWAIAADGDESASGGHILTSAGRRVDVALFETIQEARSGGFTGGESIVFDVASGGVDMGEISGEVPADVLSQVQSVQDDLAAGKITAISG